MSQQVSNILVHPDFHTSQDSDIAVLKLTDKAKISERVLPVCLPEIQGGEVTSQQTFTMRWMSPNDQKHLSRYTPLSQTKLVELGDIAQCEREFAQGGAHSTVLSHNTLCVIGKPSSPQSSCPSVIPGIANTPVLPSSTSGVLSGHEETPGSPRIRWHLLGLESFIYKETDCHRQTYTVHTNIANFRDWIIANMK